MRKNPLKAFEEEIMQKVIAPKIMETVQAHGPEISSKLKLAEFFREDHGVEVSDSALSKWMSLCGFKVQQQTVVNHPEMYIAQGFEDPVDRDLSFDNEMGGIIGMARPIQ